MAAEVARIDAMVAAHRRLARARSAEFRGGLAAMREQGLENAAMIGEAGRRQLWALFEQFCDAMGMALDRWLYAINLYISHHI
jgi:hypothetical protein